MQTPLLLRPSLLSLKNQIAHSNFDRTSRMRGGLIIFFCIMIVGLIAKATLETLLKLKTLESYIYLPPSQPVGLILLMLFVMLVASNAAIGIGTIYLGKDVDLVLASPLTSFRIFVGKYTYILGATSWMPLLFLTPFLWALGYHYEAAWSYYPLCLLTLVPFFIIATSLSVLLILLITSSLSASHTKEALIACAFLALLAAANLLDLIEQKADVLSSTKELIRLLGLLSLSEILWLPSNWIGSIIDSMLLTEAPFAHRQVQLLILVAIGLLALSYAMFHLMVFRGISRMQSIKTNAKRVDSSLHKGVSEMIPGISQKERALLAKDVRSYIRDMTHMGQFVVLLILCSFYLYNLRIFRAVDTLPDNIRFSWTQILYVINLGMGSFIAVAVGTRFIFPSISLEGQGYWIIRTGPLSLHEFIESKFRYWYLPVSLITSGFFTAGAYTIGASPGILFIHFISAFIITYGVVGLAVGLGAIFAKFDWEYATELAASFGSFVFMLSSIVLVLVSLIPGVVLILLHEYQAKLGLTARCLLAFALTLCLIYLNFLVKKTIVQKGAEALEARERL